MILGKKDKRLIETLKEERLEAIKKYEALQKEYGELKDCYYSLGRYRKAEFEQLLSGTGLDLDDLAYLCNMKLSELEKIYNGKVKMTDEEFLKLVCKIFRGMLRMSR